MNKHIEKAMELRNETPMVSNCSQTIMRCYAEDMGISEEMAAGLGCNFGGGMKCGGICGAITGGLMVLGAKGVENPAKVNEFRSRKALGIKAPDHRCTAPESEQGYRFSKAMSNPGFIGVDAIKDVYLPMGFSNFKIEGRGLGSALVLEFLLYYMTKPEYQIHVREAIYLDNMLDLF